MHGAVRSREVESKELGDTACGAMSADDDDRRTDDARASISELRRFRFQKHRQRNAKKKREKEEGKERRPKADVTRVHSKSMIRGGLQ
jgi:hypothetical protein